jgi:lipoprotein NlpI
MSVQLMYRGVMAEAMRNGISQITSAQLRKFYEGNIGKRYPNAILMGDPIVVDTQQQNALSVELQFRIKDFLQVSEGDWLLQYQSPNLQDQFFAPGNTNRNTPLAIPGYRSIHRYQLELTLPEEFDARYNPSQRMVENPAFVFAKTLSFKGRTLSAAMDLNVRADRVAAKEVPVFSTDLNKVGDMMQGALYIRKSDLRAANAATAVALPLKQQVLDRLEQIIKTSSRMLAQAKTDGRDQSAALCERAKATAYLGRYAEALADAQNAVRHKPNDAEALACRAEVESAAGEFKSSEQDYSRAMALGASSEDLYLQRGIATFYQGKFLLAKDDFAKVVSLSGVASEKVRADIWRILALRRAGLAPKAEKMGNVTEDEWPSVVPAFLLGQSTPETMLRAAHKSTGDRLDWHLTEAYFYLGQHYLLADDKTKARLYFQHAIDKGVLYSAYYNAARHELARLQ